MKQKSRKVSKKLPVVLTPHERQEREAELLEALKGARDLKAQKSSVVQTFNAEIKLAVNRVDELEKVLRTKTEMRDVECEEAPDFVDGKMVTTRLDTGDVVERRPLSLEERQGKLPLPETAPAPKAPGRPKKAAVTPEPLTATVAEVAAQKGKRGGGRGKKGRGA